MRIHQCFQAAKRASMICSGALETDILQKHHTHILNNNIIHQVAHNQHCLSFICMSFTFIIMFLEPHHKVVTSQDEVKMYQVYWATPAMGFHMLFIYLPSSHRKTEQFSHNKFLWQHNLNNMDSHQMKWLWCGTTSTSNETHFSSIRPSFPLMWRLLLLWQIYFGRLIYSPSASPWKQENWGIHEYWMVDPI